jgi:hypothetical protein
MNMQRRPHMNSGLVRHLDMQSEGEVALVMWLNDPDVFEAIFILNNMFLEKREFRIVYKSSPQPQSAPSENPRDGNEPGVGL